MKEQLYLAIDGGGTKTEFVLFDREGNIRRRTVRSGSNINTCGITGAASVIRSGIDEMKAPGRELCRVYAGIAGCGAEENRQQILAVLRDSCPDASVHAHSDIHNVINCFPELHRMIAVICGTGSVVYAKTPDGLRQFGGWGYLFDPGGSGYTFGRDAISAALAQRNGIGPETAITKLVERQLGGKVTERITDLYAGGSACIASFALPVFEAYREKDPIAGEIIDRNIARIYLLITAAADQTDCGDTVVLSGGLVKEKVILEEKLNALSGRKFRFLFNEMPQIVGAAVCCMSASPSPVPDFISFRDTFFKKYTEYMRTEKC